MADGYQTVKMQDAVAATGNGTAIACAQPTSSPSTVAMQVVGATAGSSVVTFEGTIDGTNYVSVLATNVTSGATAVTATDGIFRIDSRGFLKVRARVSTFGTGTVTVVGMGVEI